MAKVKSKVKVRVDPRNDWRDLDGKLTYEQFGGGYIDKDIDEVPDVEQFTEAMVGADWTDDPGTGRAILLPDGRELLNPVPVAPPLSIAQSAEPSVNDLVERAIKRHFEQLKGDDEVDTQEEMDDFPDDVEFNPGSIYEIMLDEGPSIPKDAVVDAGGDGAKEPPQPPAPPVAPAVDPPPNA